MKRTDLLTALQAVLPSLAKSGNRATELTHFWFDGDSVSGYNGRFAIFVTLPTDFRGGVEPTLLSWLEKTEGDTADLRLEDGKIRISVGQARGDFLLLEANRQPMKSGNIDEMLPPNRPDVEFFDQFIKLNREFTEQLGHVLLSLDEKSAVPARMGAFLVPGDGVLDVYSTDDNTISWLRMPLPPGFTTDTPFVVVPTGFLQQLVTLKPTADEPVLVYFHQLSVLAMTPSASMIFVGHLIDCPNLPDFVGELANFTDTPGVAIPEQLIPALQRILLIENAAVSFDVDDSVLHMQSERSERGTGRLSERVPLPGHQPVGTYYDAELLLRAVKGRSSILIGRNALRLQGPDNFMHLIAASRQRD